MSGPEITTADIALAERIIVRLGINPLPHYAQMVAEELARDQCRSRQDDNVVTFRGKTLLDISVDRVLDNAHFKHRLIAGEYDEPTLWVQPPPCGPRGSAA